MAQLNLTVGDIDGNTDRIIDAARRAVAEYDAALVVFPELALTGYPPEDLLLRPSLGRRVERALARLWTENIKTSIALGYPRLQGGNGGADEGESESESKDEDRPRLFNSLTVISDGRRVLTYDKQYLPNYQVFDERRYFTPGDGVKTLDLRGVRIAFTICEDLWRSAPMRQARRVGTQLLVCINASPYHAGKQQERRRLLARRCTEAGCPIVYVNMVGGQDELVFDGASMAVSADGELRRLAPAFEEGLYPLQVEIPADAQERIKPRPGMRVPPPVTVASAIAAGPCTVPPQETAPPLSPEAELYRALVLGVRDYVAKNRFPGAVLGLSGGIDSALTLAIAVDALGASKVQAVMMPSCHTSELSLQAAAEQATGLGVDYRVIPIDGAYDAFMGALREEFAGTEADSSEENIQARCRGVLLMAISNKKGLLVLTTGNKSEIAVGYSTLYGDMAGGFDVLKDVSKTLVYRLAAYRNEEAAKQGGGPEQGGGKEREKGQAKAEVIPQAVIERAPSAELAPGQLDQDSLPPYEMLDRILELYVERDFSAAAIIAEGFPAEEVKRVLGMVDRNEYKRRQSPIGVRLTRRAFGRDRRYPITNAWPLGD